MIKHLMPLLRRFVGGNRRIMIVVGLAVSAIIIPLGVYLLMEGEDPLQVQTGFYLSLVGPILLIITLIMAFREENKEKDLTEKRFQDLISAIKGNKPIIFRGNRYGNRKRNRL